jgi:hypothetical protein
MTKETAAMEMSADTLDVLRTAIRPLLLALVLMGLWLGLERAQFERRIHIATWLTVAVPLVAWFLFNWYLAQIGFFRSTGPVPWLPIAVVVPVTLALTLMLRSERIGRLIDAIPPLWLIGYQATRVLGGVFVLRWAQGQLPGEFALPAGIGDVLTGLFAIPVAIYLTRGGRYSRAAAYAWNIFGILDLVDALFLGAISSPGRIQLIAFDLPNTVSFDPSLVIIPTYAVPVALILHGLSLWQLRRRAKRDAQRHGTLHTAAA